MTVVGIKCNGAVFSRHSKRKSTPEIVLSRIFQNYASKMANCIIVDIINYLIILLANSFLVFISFH